MRDPARGVRRIDCCRECIDHFAKTLFVCPQSFVAGLALDRQR
jgi:hypothetical protein